MIDDEDDELTEMWRKWEAVSDEFLRFDNLTESECPFSSPDLCAFTLLDKKFPDARKMKMVSAAEHDQIWLRIESEQIEQLTDADILYLTRCGVMYEDDTESLSMFV